MPSLSSLPITAILAALINTSLAGGYSCPPGGPVNDCAVNPTLMSPGSLGFNTSTANTDGPPNFQCSYGKDVWFLIQAPADGELTVTLATPSFDSTLAVYYLGTSPIFDPADLALFYTGCVDIEGPGGETANFPAVAGVYYLLQVAGFDSGAGAEFGSGVVSAAFLPSPLGFNAGTPSMVGVQPHWGACCDINGDGHNDLVTANELGTVSLLINDGTGSFPATATTFPIPGAGQLTSVACCHLDGDGYLDLAVTSFGSGVFLLKNSGTGTFMLYAFLNATSAHSVACCDLNGDGLSDLAVAREGVDTVTVFLNEGGGVFDDQLSATNHPVGDAPTAIACCDLNADGLMDLATANILGDSVSILFNQGLAVFGPAVSHAVGAGPGFLVCCDLDNDGAQDIATPDVGADTVSVLLNQGTGSFAPAVAFPAGSDPSYITCADLDCDGDLDLVVANYQPFSGGLSALMNNGDATFTSLVNFMSFEAPYAVEACDLDSSGGTDLWVVSRGAFPPEGLVIPLLNTTAGCACDPTTVVTDPSFEINPLIGYGDALDHFVTNQGKWGAESGTIVTGPDNGVTPISGSNMLRMTNDGLVTTQTVQVIDVSWLAGPIDAGLVDAELSARFNAGTGVGAAAAAPVLRFFSTSSYGSLISSVSNGATLDAHPTTWELLSVNSTIPTGTQWIVVEVLFANATIGAGAGYVDDVSLCIRQDATAPSDCRVFWKRGGGGGTSITTAEYNGLNPSVFDSGSSSISPSVALDLDPSPSLYWADTALLVDNALAPTGEAIFGSLPCAGSTVLLTASQSYLYVGCVQSLQFYRIALSTGPAELLPIAPAMVGTLRAVAFHCTEQKLYIAGEADIWRCDPDGTNFTHVVSIPPIAPNGFAHLSAMDFDYPGNAIYVLGSYGSGLFPDQAFISRVSLPGAVLSSVLIGDGPVGYLGNAYRGIAVDGAVGLMWWTSENLSGVSQVRRSSLSGTSPAVIATANPTETFNGIAVTRCLSACLPGCVGDLGGDGHVDGADLGVLLGNWGGPGSGDLDGDGTVSGADLGLLLGAWGPCT